MKLVAIAHQAQPYARMEFRDPVTKAPVDVFRDPNLTDAHTQPILADSAGRFPAIYLPRMDLDVEVLPWS